MKVRTRAAAAAGVLVISGSVAACGGTVPGDPYSTAAPAAAPPAAIPSPPAAPARKEISAQPPALTIVTARTAALGRVVADGRGWILYRFDKDRGNPSPRSTCVGACAKKWPPVLVHGTTAVKGVSSSIVGKVRREDGSWQLTLHGWPVYRFAGDTAPGQWKGQGVGGTWHTIKRTGARNTLRPAPARADATTASVSDGYGNTSDY